MPKDKPKWKKLRKRDKKTRRLESDLLKRMILMRILPLTPEELKLINKSEKLSKEEIPLMIIPAIALMMNMLKIKKEVENRRKKMRKLIDWEKKLEQLPKKKLIESQLNSNEKMLKPKLTLKKRPKKEKARNTKRKKKLLQSSKKLQNQLQVERQLSMMLKSRNNTLNQKSNLRNIRKKKWKKRKSRLKIKSNNQLKLKRKKMLRHQPKSRHQPQLQSDRTMITKIHTMRKNTHLRMTKPL